MKYYQEITLIDGEKSLYEIWSMIYQQLHIALADVKNKQGIDTIGVSFPNYRYENKDGKEFGTLGNKLRVFANSEKDLQSLNLANCLSRLTDYVHIKSIAEVGQQATSQVSVHRYRFKPMEKQGQSLAKKMAVSVDDAMEIVKKRQPEKHVPFISMHSETNDSDYPLKIWQRPCEQAETGKFNTYGMSSMQDCVTVPHWVT